MAQRLKQYYLEKVVPQLTEEFNYKNNLQVPKLQKIVINRGLGEAAQNPKFLDSCINELSLISGQRGVTKISKKAIAGFKVLAQKALMVMGIIVLVSKNN